MCVSAGVLTLSCRKRSCFRVPKSSFSNTSETSSTKSAQSSSNQFPSSKTRSALSATPSSTRKTRSRPFAATADTISTKLASQSPSGGSVSVPYVEKMLINMKLKVPANVLEVTSSKLVKGDYLVINRQFSDKDVELFA